MRRVALALLALALGSVPAAQSPQPRPAQADAVVRLLADLETALAANSFDSVRALAADSLKPAELSGIRQTFAGGSVVSATVRERARQQVATGLEVLADVLVSRGRTGRIATWQLTLRARPNTPDRYEIVSFLELAGLDGLLKISLDTSKPYAVHNLTVQAPDFTLHMASGSAFVADAPGGVTGLVLLGKGDVRFAPPDPGEQGQLKLYSGAPVLEQSVDAAFVRVNPAEFAAHVTEHGLVPSRDAATDLTRAQAIFADFAPRTFNLDLGDFTDERWSIEPSAGSVVVEFRTKRFAWLTYTRSPTDPEDISLFDRARLRNVSSYASPERLATRGRFYSEDDDAAYDIERYGLDITFDPVRSWVSGRGSLRVKIRKPAVSTVTFKLAQSLTVLSVSSPNFGRLLALRISGQNNVIVSLPSYVVQDTDLQFDVVYSGRLDPQSLEREALQIQGVPPQEPSTIVPIIEPERRYLYSNRSLWYPQGPVTDYATASMRLSVPSQYQIVASGSLIGSKVAEGRDETGRVDGRMLRTVEYATDRPVRYLSCVISRFAPVSRQRIVVPAVAPGLTIGLDKPGEGAGVNIEVVATPIAASHGRQVAIRVADVMRTYAKIIGEAPYPDFTLASVEDNLPGGHSPPYFALVLQPLATSPYNWAQDPVAFDSQYPSFILAHEVAHQWWGQAVGWKNYHEQWLSEGLAQYFAVLYAASDRGPEMLRTLISQMRQSAQQYGPQGPISLGYRLGHIQGEGKVFRAVDYNKSAVVLHMLRRLIGDEAFFAGLRRFYTEWRFRKAGTDDIRQAFEAEAKVPLTRFFDRWILAAEIPKVAVLARADPSGKSLLVRIEQSGDVFDFPYTVTVQYADGRSEDITIPVSEAVTERTIPFSGTVKRVVMKDDLALVTYTK